MVPMNPVVNAGGQQLVLKALGEPMDEAFSRLCVAWFESGKLIWDGFDPAAVEFFTRNMGAWSVHDDFFNNCTIIC